MNISSLFFLIINLLPTIILLDSFISCEPNVRKLNSDLSAAISITSDQYWKNVTKSIEHHIRNQSFQIYQKWNRILLKHDLRQKVNASCLNVIEHIIRNPLDQIWIAKSKKKRKSNISD